MKDDLVIYKYSFKNVMKSAQLDNILLWGALNLYGASAIDDKYLAKYNIAFDGENFYSVFANVDSVKINDEIIYTDEIFDESDTHSEEFYKEYITSDDDDIPDKIYDSIEFVDGVEAVVTYLLDLGYNFVEVVDAAKQLDIIS